jgi:phage terminase Nu1 subunit (DNA packaging protein)
MINENDVMHAVELLPSMAARVEKATELILDNDSALRELQLWIAAAKAANATGAMLEDGLESRELLATIAVTAENAHAIHLKTPSRDGAVHIETIRQCVYKLRDVGLVNVTTKVRE